MENLTKDQLLEHYQEIGYKTEEGKSSLTVYLHKGNGQNFIVTYDFRVNVFFLKRYYTNGSDNTYSNHNRKYSGIKILSHAQAETLYWT